jgi:hypothetical protein
VQSAVRLFVESLRARSLPVPDDNPEVQVNMRETAEAFVYVVGFTETAGNANSESEPQDAEHAILHNPETNAIVSVPVFSGRDMPAGTLRGIIADAGLTVAEFRALLR